MPCVWFAPARSLIGTNPDLTGPVEGGIVPACPRADRAHRAGYRQTGLLHRQAQPADDAPRPCSTLGTHRADTAIIGDRMDTDVIAGIETELDTVLVLSGVTSREMLADFPYCPKYVLSGVGDIPRL